jgi:hypothetical protein
MAHVTLPPGTAHRVAGRGGGESAREHPATGQIIPARAATARERPAVAGCRRI